RPVTRDQILDTAWGTAEFPTNRTVDNYIVKFRKTFGTDWFVTRHGTGYELAE
ncbi:MAG: winged helix-turn-helix domain-containing protein, partial [Spirochaetia bacterium]|nr:winged helix-turn-helix domain-containing protein [Spirochaetia bacterium]